MKNISYFFFYFFFCVCVCVLRRLKKLRAAFQMQSPLLQEFCVSMVSGSPPVSGQEAGDQPFPARALCSHLKPLGFSAICCDKSSMCNKAALSHTVSHHSGDTATLPGASYSADDLQSLFDNTNSFLGHTSTVTCVQQLLQERLMQCQCFWADRVCESLSSVVVWLLLQNARVFAEVLTHFYHKNVTLVYSELLKENLSGTVQILKLYCANAMLYSSRKSKLHQVLL